jgi:hypothetical protein
MLVEPKPETVEALLDATWRVAAAETAQTDSLDRKAVALATFAALALPIAANLGRDAQANAALFGLGLALLVTAVSAAVWALLPEEHVLVGAAYVERFTSWRETMRPAARVRGDLMATLIEAIAVERSKNRRKTLIVRAAFILLVLGLALIAVDASIVIATKGGAS